MVIDAVGKNGGHTAVRLEHPTGICIQTLLNFDPDGRMKLIPLGNPGRAIDKDTFKEVHSIVPVGHEVLSVPFEPVIPWLPSDPDIELGPHNSAVLLDPGDPADGEFSTDVANEAVIAVIVSLTPALAVIANKA